MQTERRNYAYGYGIDTPDTDWRKRPFYEEGDMKS